MSTESSPKDTGSPSTPIPTVVNGVPSTPSTTMVVVPEVPILTPIRPVVATQPIVTNPFGSLFGTPGYNSQSIPSVSNPFSFGMPNMTSQLSSSIPATNANPSLGPGGMAPPHTPLSFGGSQIPQMNPTVGGQPPFPLGLILVSMLLDGVLNRVDKPLPIFHPFPLPPPRRFRLNTFVMTNPPLSSIFPPRGSQFHAMGNPQPGATLAGGNVYNPHYTIPTVWCPYNLL
jgi:hypothetical protein